MRDNGKTTVNMDWVHKHQQFVGKETWPDGSVFEGHFKHGKKNGQGTYVWSYGCRYEGDWLDNKITGVVGLLAT
jgi:hypothetical protein